MRLSSRVSTWWSTPLRRASPTRRRRCPRGSLRARSSPTTWSTAATRRSSPPRARRACGPATASACWSSRPRSRSSFGAACVPRPRRCCGSCVAARRFWRAVVKGLFYSVGALLIAFLIAQLWFFSQIYYWSRYRPDTTAFMESRLAANPKLKLDHTWVRYNQISVHLKRAVVVAEDAKFLDHEGFDWDAIQD